MSVQCATFALMTIGLGPARPQLPLHLDHPTTGDRCHYPTPELERRCLEVLDLLAHIRLVQIEQLGAWPPPPDRGVGGTDGFDVYLDPRERETAYVQGSSRDVDSDDGRAAVTSWMVLDPRLEPDVLPVWLAHEFHHATQFATDAAEPSLALWEGGAVWAEEATWPGQGTSADWIPDFQATPWWSLLGDGYGLLRQHNLWSYYEYGAVHWLQHVEQTTGLDPIALFRAGAQEGWRNEPDVLDVLDDHGGWEQALLAYARDRAKGPPPAIEGALTPATPTWQPDPPPSDLGMVFARVHGSGEVNIRAPEGSRWGLVDVERGTRVIDRALTVQGPTTIAAVALGPPGFDADDPARERPLLLSWSASDAAEASPPPPPSGCATGGGAWWALLLFRRRRSAARVAGGRPEARGPAGPRASTSAIPAGT